MSSQASHPFTCNTCQVAFRSSELQRTHMQADWHRYNLKRRVASLPPLSSEIFAEKVLANKASAAATAARASFERPCEACTKTYYSENAYVNHLSSNKHKANALRLQRSGRGRDEDVNSVMSSTFLAGEPSEQASVASTVVGDAEEEFSEVVNGIREATLEEEEDEDDPISRRPSRPHHSAVGDKTPHPLSPAGPGTPTNGIQPAPNGEITKEEAVRQCLFCTHLADSMKENFKHMQLTHGMFVPEREFLVDAEGLLLHLSRKVHIEYQCLYCGRLKWSEDGIKTHMRDLSHCKIAYDTETQQLDIGDFYDFRSTYSDDFPSDEEENEEMPDAGAARGGGVKLGAKRTATTAGNDDAAEDEGWETDSTVSSVPSEEIGALYSDLSKEEIRSRLQRNKSDPKKHHNTDGYHSHAHSTPHAVYTDDYELYLPTGRIAGHRSMNKYFRQNLRNYPSPAERAEQEEQQRQQRLLTQDGEHSGSDDDGDDRDGRGRVRDRDRQLTARANGGTGMMGVSEAGKRHVQAAEVREKKRAQREQARQQWRTDLKGNSQKHYRDPLLQ